MRGENRRSTDSHIGTIGIARSEGISDYDAICAIGVTLSVNYRIARAIRRRYINPVLLPLESEAGRAIGIDTESDIAAL